MDAFFAADFADQLGAGDTADFPDVPTQSGHEHAQAWQQHQYQLIDSGIHSVQGTAAPSVCSQPINALDDGMDQQSSWSGAGGGSSGMSNIGGPASYLASDPSGMLSPGTPLSSSGGTTNTPIPVDQCGPATVVAINSGYSSGPPSNLGFGNGAAAGGHFDEASDLADAASALPELVPLLEDDDPVVVGQAAMMINQLSKSRQNLEIIIKTDGMLDALVRSLDSAAPEPARWLTGTLHQMSQTAAGLSVIFEAGGVPALIRQLSSNIEVIQFYSITTLHNLLLYQDGAKEQVRGCGGIPVIVGLLKKNNQKFLAICTDCLQLLSFRHPQTKLQICAAGGPAELVHILMNNNYEKLLWTTTRVLKVLSVCPESKVAVINAGGIDALTKHLARTPQEPRGPNPSQRLLHNCLWTLRNLSDAATSQEIDGPLFERLISLLSYPDHTVVSCSAGILSNLTCNNQKSKQQVCTSGGIKALIEAIKRSGDHEEIIEPCVCALRHLTVRHEEACRAQESVRFFDGLSVLSHLFNVTSTWSVKKAVINLVRNLALCPGNCAALREKGVVTQLCSVLQSAHAEMQSAAATADAAARIRSGRYDELAEACCGALQLLARDPESRVGLAQHCCQLLCQLLFQPCAGDQLPRAALGLLWELSSQPEVPAYLASHVPLLNRLAELAQHGPSDPCRQYAALLLRQIEQQQQQQQKQGAGNNMMQTLLEEAPPPQHQQQQQPPQPPTMMQQQQPQQIMYAAAPPVQQYHQQHQQHQQPPPPPYQQPYHRMIPSSSGSYPMMQQQPQPHYPMNNGFYTMNHAPPPQINGWGPNSSSGHSSGFASPMQQQQHLQYMHQHQSSGGHTPIFEDAPMG